jgi:hypothetical protein
VSITWRASLQVDLKAEFDMLYAESECVVA